MRIPQDRPGDGTASPGARRRAHFVYLLRCGDGSYYTGYTTDPARRLAAHRAGRGARYTRGRLPLRLVALWRCPTLSAAFRLELLLKKLPRALKHRLAVRRVRDEFSGRFAHAVAARVRHVSKSRAGLRRPLPSSKSSGG